jgi:hypothetical protein
MCEKSRVLGIIFALLGTVRSLAKTRVHLALENLALRQQLAIYKRKTPRVRLARSDKALWVILSKLWAPTTRRRNFSCATGIQSTVSAFGVVGSISGSRRC